MAWDGGDRLRPGCVEVPGNFLPSTSKRQRNTLETRPGYAVTR
jgi:hypothetical protein